MYLVKWLTSELTHLLNLLSAGERCVLSLFTIRGISSCFCIFTGSLPSCKTNKNRLMHFFLYIYNFVILFILMQNIITLVHFTLQVLNSHICKMSTLYTSTLRSFRCSAQQKRAQNNKHFHRAPDVILDSAEMVTKTST